MLDFSSQLLAWFDQHGRTNLPWQATHNMSNSNHPCANVYHVWLSEIMLQQTQVATVIDYFNRFTRLFPTLNDLAAAPEDAVLAQWAGLGYYARARNLHKTAKIIAYDYDGKFPQKFEQVIALPGIGQSTAGAILSLSFGQKHAILDGNVKRVLARYHQVKGHYSQKDTINQLWHLAKQYTPNKRNADYTQAIMDLGATLCTRSKPDCPHCPLAQCCQAKQHKTQRDYPNPKPKKTKPTRSVAMLIYQNVAGEIYLEKRPKKGIWGGLWSFSECEIDMQNITKHIKAFDKNADVTKGLPVIKHSFTHYHLLISPILINCNKSKGFQSIATLKVGLPAPVKKIIAELD